MPFPAVYPVYQPGKQMADGDLLRAMMEEFNSCETGITARAGGTKALARPLVNANNEISVCATAADSVLLPTASVGRRLSVRNSGVASMQVFGSGNDTINGVATATGVAQAAGTTAEYICMSISAGVGAWFRNLSA